MEPNHTSENPSVGTIPAGWIGGFEQSNPEFAYPKPNLTSLPLLNNMDNIQKLDRQQKVLWPEFSWQTEIGQESSRCFQMFSPDISRIGYTDEGRVYSIICPQQGIYVPGLGALNIEVTVATQRGWVDETTVQVAADMQCLGQIWFSPSTYDSWLFKALEWANKEISQPFPLTKADSIKINLLHATPPDNFTNPADHILPVRDGQNPRFAPPAFTLHPEAWSVKNVEVQIGDIQKTGHVMVDTFNQFMMDIFNLGSGHLLTPGNTLTWNVWVNPPELVDRVEWQEHAEKWRKSIDVGHGSPTGPGTSPRYFDGTPFSATGLIETEIKQKLEELINWLKHQLHFPF
jgi:hypothetical protein